MTINYYNYILFFTLIELVLYLLFHDKLEFDLEKIIFLGIFATFIYILIDFVYYKYINIKKSEDPINIVHSNIVHSNNVPSNIVPSNNVPSNNIPSNNYDDNKYVKYLSLIEDYNNIYKLFKGTYSKGVISAGYGNIIEEENNDEENNKEMTGGSKDLIDKIKHEYKIMKKIKSVKPKPYKKTEKELPKSREEIEEKEKEKKELSKRTNILNNDSIYYRNPNSLYNNDIINIIYLNKILQREKDDNILIFENEIPKYLTNISKLRFEKKNTNITRNTPIRYGDIVYIKHNVYENNKNIAKYIKHGQSLKSHQDDNKTYSEFQLFDPENIHNLNHVEISKPVLIAKVDTTEKNKFLSIVDNKIKLNSSLLKASHFNLEMVRPFEILNKHLALDSDEYLFS